MTVAADYSTKTYTANGTATTFPWTADYDGTYGTLIVTEVNSSGETVQTYVEGTDYTIQGKDVVFFTAPANGKKIKLDRKTYRGQQTDYIEGEDFPAEDFEKSLDRLFMISQEQDHDITKNKTDIGKLRTDLAAETARAQGVEGSLSDLTTTAKDNLVAAINEIDGAVDTIAGTLATYGDIVTHNADEFATAAQGTKADSALQKADITTGGSNGTIKVKGTDVAVKGLDSAAYAKTTDFAKPSDIPTVNNATISFKQSGVTKGSITLNQSDDEEIELDAGGSGGGLGETIFIEVSTKSVAASDDTISFNISESIDEDKVYYPIVTFPDNYPNNRGMLPFISKTAYFFSGTNSKIVNVPIDDAQNFIASGSTTTLYTIIICLIPIAVIGELGYGECFGITNGQYYGVNVNDTPYDRYYTKTEVGSLIAANKSFKGLFDKTAAYSAGDIVLAGANDDTYFLVKQDIPANTYQSKPTNPYSDSYVTAISIGNGRIPYAGQASNSIYLAGVASKPYLSDNNPTATGLLKCGVDSVDVPYYNAATGELYAPAGVNGLNRRMFTNVEVATTDWTSDNTYTDYPYSASIDLDFVASNGICYVCFGMEEATSGNYAPVADYDDTTGYLTLWAKEVPNGDITIPWIKMEW